MSKIDLIIQARMGSTRLPGKSLMDLAGAPLVGRILERVRRCNNISEIILAVPNTEENNGLAALGDRYAVSVFRGNENDLVDRYYKCAVQHNSEVILRLPGDNPVPEPREIDRLIDFHMKNGADFSSNITNFFENGYPDGIGVEAISLDALKNIWHFEDDPSKREHIASNFIEYSSGKVASADYVVKTIDCPKQISRPDLILDVNTIGEYLYIKKMYEDLYQRNQFFGIKEIINWHDSIGFSIDKNLKLGLHK